MISNGVRVSFILRADTTFAVYFHMFAIETKANCQKKKNKWVYWSTERMTENETLLCFGLWVDDILLLNCLSSYLEKGHASQLLVLWPFQSKQHHEKHFSSFASQCKPCLDLFHVRLHNIDRNVPYTNKKC